jgi:hypothetical protein
MLFTVKICGLTTPDHAALAAAAGADAIGLNFVAGSPRVLGIDQAEAVAAAVPPGVLKVGVFAGATAAEIRRIAEAVGLDAVQLHGHLDGAGPGVDPPERCVPSSPGSRSSAPFASIHRATPSPLPACGSPLPPPSAIRPRW